MKTWLAGLAAVSLLVVAACDRGGPAPVRHEKPTAPVRVALEARPAGGGLWELALTATPTRDVADLTLDVAGRRRSFGPTAAGTTRTLVARAQGGAEVIGRATVQIGGRTMMRAAIARPGLAAAPAPAPAVRRVVTLPGGDRVAEVQP